MDKGLEPDKVTFQVMIKTLCKEGNFDEAFKLWDAITAQSMLLSSAMYTALVNGLCRKGASF